MNDEIGFDGFFYPAEITPKEGSLHAFFCRVPGGLEAMMNFIANAAAEDSQMGELLEVVAEVMSFKRAHWDLYEGRPLYWERVCQEVGLKPSTFRAIMMAEIDTYNSHLSHLQAISAQPDLVRASVELGRIPDKGSFNDRQAIFKHTRFVPVPQTSIVNTQTTQNLSIAGTSLPLLSSFEESARRSVDAIRAGEPEQRMLPQGDDYIDSEAEED